MATNAPAPAPSSQQSGEVDPISKFKVLIPRMRDALSNVMKVAAQVFYQNSQIDTLKSSDTPAQRIDKSLEEFYAVCDQIELNLHLALECHHQSSDNIKNSPIPIQGHGAKIDQQQAQETQSYPQYLNTVRLQIAHAKELHDALMECAKKLSERQQQPISHQMQTSHTATQGPAVNVQGSGMAGHIANSMQQ